MQRDTRDAGKEEISLVTRYSAALLSRVGRTRFGSYRKVRTKKILPLVKDTRRARPPGDSILALRFLTTSGGRSVFPDL